MAKKNAIEKIEGNTITINDMTAFGEHLEKVNEQLTRNVKIRKAKIKDSLFLEVEYTEQLPSHGKKETKMSCRVPVHDDLKYAFEKLHVHLAILCDEVKTPKKSEFETVDFEGFAIRSFSIGGNDENEGVTLSGSKEGKYGNVNLNTPFTKWEDSEYPFVADLAADIQAAIYEVEQYLFEGKRAPEQQLEMDFGGEEEKAEEAISE